MISMDHHQELCIKTLLYLMLPVTLYELEAPLVRQNGLAVDLLFLCQNLSTELRRCQQAASRHLQ